MILLAAASALTVSIPQGGLAVNQDMGILSFERVQILPQNRLAAHGIHQGYLHAGELDVGRHQVHALRVVQDALAGFDRLVHENTAHRIGQGKGQLVRLRVAQADGEAGLRVSITSSTFFPACASPMPKLAQVVVLPTPPFWLATAMICGFNDFTSFLIGCCHVPA